MILGEDDAYVGKLQENLMDALQTSLLWSFIERGMHVAHVTRGQWTWWFFHGSLLFYQKIFWCIYNKDVFIDMEAWKGKGIVLSEYWIWMGRADVMLGWWGEIYPRGCQEWMKASLLGSLCSPNEPETSCLSIIHSCSQVSFVVGGMINIWYWKTYWI